MANVKLHTDYETIEAENVDTFQRYGTSSASLILHRCVICGRGTSIDESYSCRGHNLVCSHCAWDEKKFVAPVEALYWAEGREMPKNLYGKEE